jgi:diguanylate cyclase (GGDEF)-like protein
MSYVLKACALPLRRSLAQTKIVRTTERDIPLASKAMIARFAALPGFGSAGHGSHSGRATMNLSVLTRPSQRRDRKNDASVPLGDRLKANRGAIVAFLVCGLFALWTVVGHQPPATKKIISDVIAILIATGGTIWGFWGARSQQRTGGKRGALAANLLSLGTAGYGLGAGIYAYYDVVLHQSPFPSWADVGYMVGYVTMMAGILLLPSKPLPGIIRVRVLLDSLIVVAALVTFSWFFSLGPIALDGSQPLLGRSLGAAYPVMDLAMISCVLLLATFSHEPGIRRVRNLLCVGVVTFVVADSGYSYQTLNGSYETGQPLDAGWFLANLLFGQAAFLVRRLRSNRSAASHKTDEGRGTSLWRLLAPYALVPAVAALLVYVNQTKASGPLAGGVYGCSGVLVALMMVRQVFAIAENSRLNRFLQEAYRELEALATTDSMTGLANHRVFQERIREEVDHAREDGTPLAFLLIDVDRFKQYNDSFGHPAGDEALKIVASILKENVRTIDLVARYGGEEFAAVLPNTSAVEAILVAERIRQVCEATEFPYREVTLSIGVAVGTGEPCDLVERADMALYAAKHAGRNGVVCEGISPEVNALLAQIALAKSNALPMGWSVASDPVGQALQKPAVQGLLAMLDLRDREVERHCERVAHLCLRLAQEAGKLGVVRMTPEDVENLCVGALLHDVGKVGVPDAVLHKAEPLSEQDWSLIRLHSADGAKIVGRFPELAGAVPLVRSHHERWDGGGYPDGLEGDAIPLGARLFALADTMDAMGSDRPYRRAISFAEIRDEIRKMLGRQFDPRLVQALMAVSESEWVDLQEENVQISKAA